LPLDNSTHVNAQKALDPDQDFYFFMPSAIENNL